MAKPLSEGFVNGHANKNSNCGTSFPTEEFSNDCKSELLSANDAADKKVGEPLDMRSGPRHRPVTPLRVLRGNRNASEANSLQEIMDCLSLRMYSSQKQEVSVCVCLLLGIPWMQFIDNALGVDPSEVHINVRRILLSDIPSSQEEASNWLVERFQQKDQLLSDFSSQGHFPNEGTEGDLSMFKCLVNVFVVLSLIAICTYLTLFSSVWFKVYVALSCAYLASATYFGIWPSPIFGSLGVGLSTKKSKLV